MYRNKRALFGLVAALVLVMSASVSIQAAEMWHYWLSGVEKEALDAFLDKARELYPNVEFTERGIPGSTSEMRRQLGAAFMANDPPELYQSAIGYDMKSYVDAGRLEPIDDIWEAVNGDEIFSEGLQRMVKFDGHAYGIPLNTHVISHIFYNKHIFEKYDLDIPTTWDEFKEVSKTLRENGIEPFAAATSWTLTHFYAPLITVLGPEGYLALGNGELAFTDPKVREAFELYGDALLALMFGWSGYGWAEAVNSSYRHAAMYLNGDCRAYFEQAGWTPVKTLASSGTGHRDAIIIQVDALAALRTPRIPKAPALMTVAGSIEARARLTSTRFSCC